MQRLVLIALVSIISWQFPAMGQELMQAVPNVGVPAQELSGQIFSIGGVVHFVGRNGVWQLSGSGTSWEQQYRPSSGTLIVTASRGTAQTILFMDSIRNIWRYSPGGSVSLIVQANNAEDSYLICEASSGLMVVSHNRILGRIRSELFLSVDQKEIPTFLPALRDATPLSLEFNSRCESFILTIRGQDTNASSENIYQRYRLVDSAWRLIEDSLQSPFVTAEQPNNSFFLRNNELFETSTCPPLISGDPLLRANKANALSTLSDSTLGLFRAYDIQNSVSPIYIFDSKGRRIIDSVLVAPREVLMDVVAHEDLLLVQCQARVLVYNKGTLVSTIPWPSSSVPAIYYSAVGNGVTSTMFGPGQLAPHALSISSGEWKPLYSIGPDTVQIAEIDGACQFESVIYLWEADNLYVSAGQDAMGQYFALVKAPKRINHVRPISEGQALVLVEVASYDTVSPCWYSYSTSTGELTGRRDNWPRAGNILSITESTFDEAAGTITVGTLTYWLGGRTDTSQYPIYGVLQRGLQDEEWRMVNEGLSISLRCYALKQDKRGVLYMLAGYSDGSLSYPRPSLFVSTDVGLNWIRSTSSLPNDLGKNVRLSVTENGVFVHENSCYRVLNYGEDFGRVGFSVGDVGEIFTMLDGVDSTQMTVVTSTGVYNVTALVSGIESMTDAADYATIIGNNVTVNSETISGDVEVSIVTSVGKTVYSQRMHVEQGGKFSFYLPVELSAGVYFLVVGSRVFVVLNP
ncbi:MAG TPA: hypothetical protein VK147_00990 [Candidatus Didemnitutus sp.]|nr:hypothetical protein [Candidatus Didemnitutus sp.]